jgi:hypothetical protein
MFKQTSAKSRRTRRATVALGTTAIVAISGVALASNWIVGLTAGSSATAQSATITNISIAAVASPSPINQLYPGANGDAVATITNANSFPVTITAVQLPTNTTYAGGFTTSALNAAQSGCSAVTPSKVSWNFATASSGSSHTLTTALTVAANGSLTVTFTNAVNMASDTPLACANTFFSLPSLTGVTATGGAATVTTSPTTSSWTS